MIITYVYECPCEKGKIVTEKIAYLDFETVT